MRNWAIGIFCLFLVAACGGDSSLNGTLIVDDIPIVVGGDSNIEVTDYSLLRCEDDLTRVLALINGKRTQVQTCGTESMPAVAAVTWNVALTLAAQEHAANMANYDFFSHTGVDDSTVGSRVISQGYRWSYVAENIAAGQTSAQAVVEGWMLSEGHCHNIMSKNVTEMGLACVSNSDADYTRYWTQVFAKPF
ncbi:CAP domain-containing protein [Psychromonas antarctica]|uniref:CAP domain-containing protein n=1 Tax=Psychromonas antarctica TaxID=67573 RepID=UPI001EE7ECC3|nr:CAP domain-containing protein [Psychromonas antarctica]MCG6201774.1 CAP domain-containing protein [Psychromonas antarctica]